MTWTEKPIMQRLGEASCSKDLSHRRVTCDVDFVGALGAAGTKRRLGSALLSLDLTMNPRFLPGAIAEVVRLVGKLAQRERWLLDASGRKAKFIAVEALRHYLSPTCPGCKGRGMTGVERGPSAQWREACKACGGGGRVKFTTASGRETARACAACCGRGWVEKRAEMCAERPRPCAECGGSGIRPFGRRHASEVSRVLACLEDERMATGAAVRKKMRLRGGIE